MYRFCLIQPTKADQHYSLNEGQDPEDINSNSSKLQIKTQKSARNEAIGPEFEMKTALKTKLTLTDPAYLRDRNTHARADPS